MIETTDNTLSVADVINKAGGRVKMAEALTEKTDVYISTEAITKWRDRGRIPAEWVVAVRDILRAKRVSVKLEDLLPKPRTRA